MSRGCSEGPCTAAVAVLGGWGGADLGALRGVADGGVSVDTVTGSH